MEPINTTPSLDLEDIWKLSQAERNRMLLATAKTGGLRQIQLLLAAGARIDSIDDLGRSPLHLAIARGSVDLTRTLVLRGASLADKDHAGETPLDCAAATGNIDLLRLLCDAGAVIDQSCLEVALEHDNSEAVDFIVQRMTQSQALHELQRMRAHLAKARQERTEEARDANRAVSKAALCNPRFIVDIRSFIGMIIFNTSFGDDDYEWTAINSFLSHRKSRREMLNDLTEFCRASRNYKNMCRFVMYAAVFEWLDQASPAVFSDELHAAISMDCLTNRYDEDRERAYDFFKQCWKDLIVIQSHAQHPERSILTLAVMKGSTGLVKTLVSLGADCNQPDPQGHTPMQLANLEGRQDMVKTLTKLGAKT